MNKHSFKNEELIAKAKDGDKDAEIELLQMNEKLCFYVARRYTNTGIEVEDLASIGKIGLIKSYKTFDISKGFKFATYASMVINNEILMYLRRNKKHNGNTNLEKTLNVDIDGNELTLIDILPAPEDDIKYEDFDALKKTLKIFNDNAAENYKQILQMYFYEEKTQLEIAKVLGISQSYVARIMAAIEKMLKIIAETGKFKKVSAQSAAREKAIGRRQMNSNNKPKRRKKEKKMADKQFFKNDFVYIFKNYSLKSKEIASALGLKEQTIHNYKSKINKGEWDNVNPKIQDHVLEKIELYIAKNRQETYGKPKPKPNKINLDAMVEKTAEKVDKTFKKIVSPYGECQPIPNKLDEVKFISEDATEIDKFIESMEQPNVETKTLKVELIQKKEIKILDNRISLTSNKDDMANIILGIYELLKNTPEGSMVKMNMEFEVTK